MTKKLVALDLLNTILSKVYTKITNETNEKIELATKGYADDAFIPLTQKAAANGVATLDANGHVPVEQIVDTTDETGDEFDYLSINDTGIERHSRVHNDYSNSNPNNLIDSDTLRNYNGQWITSEPVPVDTHNFTFTGSDDPEEVAEGFSFLGTPVIRESEDHVYPDEDDSWKNWAFTPTDSYTIYTTETSYQFYKEIKDFFIEGFRPEGSKYSYMSISMHTPDDNNQSLTDGVNYTIVPTSSIKSVATINVGSMTFDDFKNALLTTGLFEEISGELIPTQTIFLSDDSDDGVFDTGAYLTFNEGQGYFSAYSNGSKYTFSGDTVLSAIKSTPATTVNPITKLGIVDEGTWVAGDVTTPNLKVNDSTELNKTTTINDDLHITEKVLDFGGTNYDVWDYANDNMNWVEE